MKRGIQCFTTIIIHITTIKFQMIYQVNPLFENAKTIFKVANAIKDDNKDEQIIKPTNKKVEPQNSPTYFL